MKAVFAAYALGALGVMSLMAAPARAEMSAEAARASVAPFYQVAECRVRQGKPGSGPAGDRAGMGILPRQRSLQQPR